jgi:hypothetical protein
MLARMGGVGSGGARSYSGPPPDPNALKRQRDGKEWTKLPAVGRLGPAPEWPLAVPAPNENELLKWLEMWTLPQALIWEVDHAFDLVAFYVRTYLEAMQHRAGAQARMFVRQLSNDLYLAPAALMSGRYVIDGTKEADAIDAAVADHAAAAANPRRRGPGKKSARDRFTVVGETGPADDDEEQPGNDVATGEATAIDDNEPPF